MIYERVSEKYIKDNLHPSLYAPLYTILYNLSSILADSNGKISRETTSLISNDLVLVTPGIMMFGAPIVDYIGLGRTELPVEEYSPQVTYEAFGVLNRLQRNDLNIITEYGTISKLVDFGKYEIHDIEARMVISAIYLDVYVLYTKLLQATAQSGLEGMTLQELERILKNIRCLSIRLEDKEEPPYMFLRILRDLSRTLSQVVTLNWLFDNTYIKNVREFRGKVNKTWKY